MMEKENLRPMGEKRRSTNGYSFTKRRAVGSTSTPRPRRICMRPIDESLYAEYGVTPPSPSKSCATRADQPDNWTKNRSDASPASITAQRPIETSFSPKECSVALKRHQASEHSLPVVQTRSSDNQAIGQIRSSVVSPSTPNGEYEEQKENISLSASQPTNDVKNRNDSALVSICQKVKGSAERTADCADRKPVGLANIGNSCFINAVLRALLSLKRVRDEINQPLEGADQGEESLERNLCKIYEYTEQKCAKEFNLRQAIRGIWKSSSLEQFRQHDAHEFLLALFDKLPFADQCFGIPLQIQVECTSCRQLRVRYDRTLDLSASPSGRNEVKKLSDCLRRSFGPESVSDLPCEQCKNCDALVIRRIMALPLLLVLCLMRFDYREKTDDHCGCSAVKLNDNVAIPAEIDLEPFCLRPAMPANYGLKAIVSHYGYSVEYGHYVCDAVADCRRNGDAEEHWYSFNDRDVERKELSGILQQRQRTAYLLFYEKIEG